MIFKDRSLTFREFAMKEAVPLSEIQQFVLEFLCDREDAAVFGAQAVNAYVDEPRMSQNVGILTLNAERLAEEIRAGLNVKFNIAVRVRTVPSGLGYQVYQLQKPNNRHLVDIRSVTKLPPCQRVERILVPIPAELISQKVISMTSRSKTAKGMTDAADLRRLLLAFPELKTKEGLVLESLKTAYALPVAIAAWSELVEQEIELESDEY